MNLNPMAQEAFASIIRSILKIGAGYLVARGVWSQGDATTYVSAAALAVVGLGWSYWTTYVSRAKLLTSLANPTLRTEAAVVDHIESGMPVPTVTTPANTRPGVPLIAMLLLACGLTFSTCAPAPPNLTPQATAAFYGTRVIQALDVVRDLAITANKQTPPVIASADLLTIVTWHRSAITIVHTAPAGWKATVQTSLTTVLATLSKSTQTLLAPYVALVQSVLAEVS